MQHHKQNNSTLTKLSPQLYSQRRRITHHCLNPTINVMGTVTLAYHLAEVSRPLIVCHKSRLHHLPRWMCWPTSPLLVTTRHHTTQPSRQTITVSRTNPIGP